MTEHYKPAYGNNVKHAPDYTRCCEEVVAYHSGWPHYSQCARRNGHGPDGAYCKQHDPEAAAKRKVEREARESARYRKQRLEWAGPRFFTVLKQIADGHNDPRSIAREAIASYDDDQDSQDGRGR